MTFEHLRLEREGAVATITIARQRVLNALGAGYPALRRVVLEQALWVGGFGIVGGAAVSTAMLLLASGQSVPVSFDFSAGVACAALVMAIALLSGVMAVRALSHLEPANLLR